MNKIEPIGIGGLHRGLTIPEIYIENTRLHDEVNGLRKQRRKAREKNKQLEKENQQLKKQKDDVVEYIKKCQLGVDINDKPYMLLQTDEGKDLLRMLGEIDVED